jgi:hypothetical protein
MWFAVAGIHEEALGPYGHVVKEIKEGWQASRSARSSMKRGR